MPTVVELPVTTYKGPVEPDWCPGCGDFGVLRGLQRAAGNRAVARAVVKPSASIPGVSVRKLQRVIGFGPLGGVPGVIVPPAAGAVLPGGFGFYRIMGGVPLVIRRPAWTGPARRRNRAG